MDLFDALRPGISIVVCCYNSSLRLLPTLEHIAGQRGLEGLNVEVLLIDNGSTDDTAIRGVEIWDSLGNPFPFRVLLEQKPGLTHARRLAILEARFPFILFCDDDNWLTQDYAITGHRLLADNPAIGMLGGRGVPVFQERPPSWFSQFQKSFALGPQNNINGKLEVPATLYGAGIFIRTKLFRAIFDSGIHSLLSGRKGNALSSGEDTELCLWCRLVGFELHYNSHLLFRHFIPVERLQQNYLLRLAREKGKTESIFLAYRDQISFGKVTWMDSTLHYHWEVTKRLSHLFFQTLVIFRLPNRMRAYKLFSSIQFRLSHHVALKGINKEINQNIKLLKSPQTKITAQLL